MQQLTATTEKNSAVQKITQFELSNQLIDSNLFKQIKLKTSSRLVLIVLCRYFPDIYPSMKTLQEKTGIGSKETLNDALKELKEKGLIIYSLGDKKSNVYKLTALFFSYLKTVPGQYGKAEYGSTDSVHNKTNNKIIKKPFNNNFNNSEAKTKTPVQTKKEIIELYEKEKHLDAPPPAYMFEIIKNISMKRQ